MRRGIAFLLLLSMLAGCPALADPVLTSGNTVVWLGEENYLYLEDDAGAVKQLPAVIVDLVGTDGENVYCLTDTGRLYAVRLDGTTSALVSSQPTDEMIGSHRAKSVQVILADNGLVTASFPDGSAQALLNGAAAVCRNATTVFMALAQADGSCLLMSCPLPEAASGLAPLLTAETAVRKPLAMFASRDAVTIVCEDHSVQVYDLTQHTLSAYPAYSQLTAGAVWTRGRLYRYTRTEAGQWRLERAESADAQPRAMLVTAAPAPRFSVVTATPAPYVTAAPRPTATVTEDKTIRKWDRGSRVRKMQQRLSDLGYPVGKVDGVYGEDTATAVSLFLSQIGYTEHSYLSEKAQRRLYASNAPFYDPYIPLKKGSRGVRVRLMQQALLARGIDPGKIDGVYGTNTVAAVAAFQQQVGMALEPGEIPGEVASRWLLMTLYGAVPPITPAPSEDPGDATPTPVPADPTATPEATDPTPSPTPETTDPTPSPTPETTDPTPSPTPEDADPTPSPTPESADPTPSPTPASTEPKEDPATQTDL